MKQRCLNPNNVRATEYADKQICKDWLKYESFHNWAITHGYEEHLTLDRKDNNLGYCPDNCRWITNQEQQNNKKNTIYIEIDGVVDTITGWSNRTGLSRTCINCRYYEQGLRGKELIKPKTRK
jgi:hypothetical protein